FALWNMEVRERDMPRATVVARWLFRDFPDNRELAAFLDARDMSPARGSSRERRRRVLLMFVPCQEVVDQGADAAGCRADRRPFLATCQRTDCGSAARAAADDQCFFLPRSWARVFRLSPPRHDGRRADDVLPARVFFELDRMQTVVVHE